MNKKRFLKGAITVVIMVALLLHGWVTLKTSIGEYVRDAIFFVFVVFPYIIGAIFFTLFTRLGALVGMIICLTMDLATFDHVFIQSHNLFAEGYLIITPILNTVIISSVTLIILLSEQHFVKKSSER